MIQKNDKSFIALFQVHPMPMWVYDLETLAFLAVNAAAVGHYGYSEAEFLGMTIRDIRPASSLPSLERHLAQAPLADFERSGIWQHRTKGGHLIDVDISSHPISFNGRACRFVLAHDVTERVHAQRKIARLNRIYAVLSGINSAIVRTRERQPLFDETCRLATSEGQFLAACIGLFDGGFTVVAHAGSAQGIVERVPAAYVPGAPLRRALDAHLPFISNDLAREQELAGLHDARIGALAALPLVVDGRGVGSLLLFAAEAHYFDADELALLGELAADVAFALHTIEREEQRQQITERLRESEAGLRRAQIMNKTGHVVSRPDGSFESWSETLPLLLGMSAIELPRSTREWLDVVHPSDRERFRDVCVQAARNNTRVAVDYRVCRGDGSEAQFRQVLEPLGETTAHGKTRWMNTIQDISEQQAQQERLLQLGRIYAVLSGVNSAIARMRERQDLFQEVCRVAVRDGGFGLAWIGVVDADTQSGRVAAWEGAAPDHFNRLQFTMRGDLPESLRPTSIAARGRKTFILNDVLAEPSLAPFRTELETYGHRALAALPLVVAERTIAVLSLYADKPNFFNEQQVKLLNDLAGDLSFALLFMEQEDRLSYLAYYDALTGLPNARLFQDRLAQLLHGHHRDQGVVAVTTLNLDRFAQLNDALGRHAGDALLKQVAQRLDAALDDADSVARIGGDTFALALLEPVRDAEALTSLQQRVFDVFEAPFMVDGREVRVAAKAGFALYPNDGDDAETLIKHAEVALRNAKISGERCLYYARSMNAAMAHRLMMENDLQRALAAQQFVVHYQPRVDLQSGAIVSAEALIRWQHPERGLIGPGEFIPLAEETGLIVPIGAWVIDAVCAQQAEWLAQQVDIVPVAVNLSAAQCRKGLVLPTIREAIARHGLAEKYLEFELTETVVMEDLDDATASMKALKALGMQLSLDDFGTGYSSLAYLKRFPFDFVKIDRAFVAGVTNSPEDAAIATAVIAMAHSLHLRVVAEGVETEGQLRFLRQRRCDEMQGFLFSPPVPAPEFEALLRGGACLPSMREEADERDTLLIVDDEPNNLSSLSRLLRRESYRVLTANSALEGLELLATNAVQVIVSDQRMPHMSGTEFLSIVKNLYPDTIRIILSGYTELEAVTDSVNRGAVFKFLTKPWDDDLLREHIRDAFRRYRPTA